MASEGLLQQASVGKREVVGTTPQGEPVERIVLQGGGLTASILSWGATVQDLRLEGHAPPLVLGFETFDPYPDHGLFFGAIAGRYANRIANGQFSIGNESHQVDRNFLGKHLLHGGANGIYHRNWTIAGNGADYAVLMLIDPDGEMGFPGTCQHKVTIRLQAGGALAFIMEAETDKTTLVNLAHHGYFTLDDTGNVLDHEMRIDAGHYLPIDEECIPTGEIAPVEGTVYDFRQPRPVRLETDGRQVLYDHNFCISGARQSIREVAKVTSPQSGVSMTVRTTEPGLQFYAGDYIETAIAGLTGERYGPYSGFCMEPQIWPDAPNREDFPSALLRPGDRYFQETHYCFMRS